MAQSLEVVLLLGNFAVTTWFDFCFRGLDGCASQSDISNDMICQASKRLLRHVFEQLSTHKSTCLNKTAGFYNLRVKRCNIDLCPRPEHEERLFFEVSSETAQAWKTLHQVQSEAALLGTAVTLQVERFTLRECFVANFALHNYRSAAEVGSILLQYNDYDLCFAAAASCPKDQAASLLCWMPESFKKCPKIVMLCVDKDPLALLEDSCNTCSKEVVIAAVQKSYVVLEHACTKRQDLELGSNLEFMKQQVLRNPEALKYATAVIRGSLLLHMLHAHPWTWHSFALQLQLVEELKGVLVVPGVMRALIAASCYQHNLLQTCKSNNKKRESYLCIITTYFDVVEAAFAINDKPEVDLELRNQVKDVVEVAVQTNYFCSSYVPLEYRPNTWAFKVALWRSRLECWRGFE